MYFNVFAPCKFSELFSDVCNNVSLKRYLVILCHMKRICDEIPTREECYVYVGTHTLTYAISSFHSCNVCQSFTSIGGDLPLPPTCPELWLSLFPDKESAAFNCHTSITFMESWLWSTFYEVKKKSCFKKQNMTGQLRNKSQNKTPNWRGQTQMKTLWGKVGFKEGVRTPMDHLLWDASS